MTIGLDIVPHRVEPHLTGLISGSPIASVISDPRQRDNPIIACNAAFIALTGYSEDEILGRNCKFLAGPATEPWLTDTIRKGVQKHRPVLVEILNYKRDGTPFRNAVLVAPIFDEDGELEFFLGSQVEVDDESPTPVSNQRVAATLLVTGRDSKTEPPQSSTAQVDEASAKMAEGSASNNPPHTAQPSGSSAALPPARSHIKGCMNSIMQ